MTPHEDALPEAFQCEGHTTLVRVLSLACTKTWGQASEA